MRMFVLLGLFATIASAQQNGAEYFEKSIRPLFVARCLGCHGAANPAGRRHVGPRTTRGELPRDRFGARSHDRQEGGVTGGCLAFGDGGPA